jgi:hypothetical protein
MAGWAARGIRRMWHLGRKANRFFDLMLGEPARDGRPARPSMMDRMASVETRLAEVQKEVADHKLWHGDPGGKPAAPDLSKPNGPTARRRTS